MNTEQRRARAITPILAILLVAGCATPDTRRSVGERERDFSGYAARGPVKPAEFTYDDPNASVRFPRSGGVVTFERLEAEAMDGGLDWPTAESARMQDEDWDDYEADFYGNEYGGSGRGGRHRRPARPPEHRPPPPEPEPAPQENEPEKTPAPDVGSEGRRGAKSAPERPSRGADARKAPGSGGR